jgi:hypothetical protein
MVSKTAGKELLQEYNARGELALAQANDIVVRRDTRHEFIIEKSRSERRDIGSEPG